MKKIININSEEDLDTFCENNWCEGCELWEICRPVTRDNINKIPEKNSSWSSVVFQNILIHNRKIKLRKLLE